MREPLVELLRCPRCGTERQLRLEVQERSASEIESGGLTCGACGHVARIVEGIVDLLYEPSEAVLREARGLERFAEEMRSDGWDRDRILRLPDEEHGYWDVLRLGM